MDNQRRRLAIVGAGSSGLIALKCAIDELADWEIVVFERTDSIVGCWGRPYAGFVSTSTKFTTQFSCFPIYSADVDRDGAKHGSEFFRAGEYGDYLEAFADEFNLRQHIRFRTTVHCVGWDAESNKWELKLEELDNPANHSMEYFDALILCSGLAAEAKQIEVDVPTLSAEQINQPDGLDKIRHQRVVVMGGGESAVDQACRLARPELDNQVYLSLQSGVRVSPRYHPIRGVPSDFLRNRLMLSIHEKMRNAIGQKFVESRICYEERFRKIFPSPNSTSRSNLLPSFARRKEWDLKLTRAAKDDLFNMFHNKSDGFLDFVARDAIRIIGLPIDRSARQFYVFQSDDRVTVEPDVIVPSIGYRQTIEKIPNSSIRLDDFYLGCVSTRFPRLFLVGFVRPIIGNIPSMSEMQAKYVVGLLSKRYRYDEDMEVQHQKD